MESALKLFAAGGFAEGKQSVGSLLGLNAAVSSGAGCSVVRKDEGVGVSNGSDPFAQCLDVGGRGVRSDRLELPPTLAIAERFFPADEDRLNSKRSTTHRKGS